MQSQKDGTKYFSVRSDSDCDSDLAPLSRFKERLESASEGEREIAEINDMFQKVGFEISQLTE